MDPFIKKVIVFVCILVGTQFFIGLCALMYVLVRQSNMY